MRSITEFLKSLPGVAPRKAYSVVLEGDLLSKELKRDLHPRSDSLFDLVTVVGPRRSGRHPAGVQGRNASNAEGEVSFERPGC